MNSIFPIKQLSDLQEVDGEILTGQKELDEVRAKLADNSAVQSAQLTLQKVENQLSDQTSIRRGIEPGVQQISEKIQAVDSRLYGGSITNPRELSAYQEEKVMLEKQAAAEEEKLLDVMVQIEDLQNSRKDARDRYDNLSTQREKDTDEFEKIEQRLVDELDALSEIRNQISSEIPQTALSTYESLLKARNGRAVAKVERGICQGCRITLPNTLLLRARNPSGPVQCSSCRRLIYVVR